MHPFVQFVIRRHAHREHEMHEQCADEHKAPGFPEWTRRGHEEDGRFAECRDAIAAPQGTQYLSQLYCNKYHFATTSVIAKS
jgi:hypothetical protein